MSSKGGSHLRATLRLAIILRDDRRCFWCSRTLEDVLRDQANPLTIDHVVPLAAGGKNIWRNLVCACDSCNSSKQATDWRTWAQSQGLDVEQTYLRMRGNFKRDERYWRDRAAWMLHHPPLWLIQHRRVVQRRFSTSAGELPEAAAPNPHDRLQQLMRTEEGLEQMTELLDIVSDGRRLRHYMKRRGDPGAGHLPFDDLLSAWVQGRRYQTR